MRFDNGQISGRQCARALFIELFGTNVFLMTSVIVKQSGAYSFAVLAVGGAAAVLLGIFYWIFAKQFRQAYAVFVHNNMPRTGTVLGILYFVRFAVRSGFLLYIFYTLLRQFLLQQSTFAYIAIPILVVCGYGALKGRERRLRSMEVMLWFVLVPFLCAVLLVVKDVNVDNLLTANTDILQRPELTTYLLPVALYSNVEYIAFLAPSLIEKDRKIKNVLFPVLLCLLCNLVLLVLAVGTLGYSVCDELAWPSLRVLQSAKVPGGFLERLDILLIAFWIFAVYSSISGALFYGGEMLSQCAFFKRQKSGQNAFLMFPVLLAMAGSLGVGYWFLSAPSAIDGYVQYALWIDVPIGLVSFCIVCFAHSRQNRARAKTVAAVACVLLLLPNLSGCASMKDVEQWNYVLTLGIDPLLGTSDYVYAFGIRDAQGTKVDWVRADTLDTAISKYAETHDNALQMGHLTAVVLGDKTYSNGSVCRDVLGQIQNETQIPVTTSVYGVAGDALCAMSNCANEQKTLGEYYEDLISNQEETVKDIVPIKNLYIAVRPKLLVVKQKGTAVEGIIVEDIALR
jgi:spore germination protein KB